jgi:hypothetical protein
MGNETSFVPATVKPVVSIADVEKLDVRVGTIAAVDEVPKSRASCSGSPWTSGTTRGRSSRA